MGNRIALVNPPNHLRDRSDLAPPLGLLVLAVVAVEAGWDPCVFDFNLPDHSEVAEAPERFYDYASACILRENPRVVALTSMGVNSHVSLLLAQRLKVIDPRIAIIIGGPHFSPLSNIIPLLYPWIKQVIAGEGEEGLAEFLCREGGTPVSRRRQQIVHPFSAYPLTPLHRYFQHNARKVVNYEGGRGCVFKCAFCYSPVHYRERREVAPRQVASEWQELSRLGFRHVFMVQDNFVNDPAGAADICLAIANEHLPLTWNAYATLPQLSSKLIKLMGAAGCRQVYLGIDAASQHQREAFNKSFFREIIQLERRILELISAGIVPTCAFLIDLFDYRKDDAESVFRVASACAKAGARIRINTLTRYPGTSMATPTAGMRYSEARTNIMLDCPKVVRANPLARERPDLFPFHCTEIDEVEWTIRLKAVRIAQTLIERHPVDFWNFSTSSDVSLETGFRLIAGDQGDMKGDASIVG